VGLELVRTQHGKLSETSEIPQQQWSKLQDFLLDAFHQGVNRNLASLKKGWQ